MSLVRETINITGYERVEYAEDPSVGLKAIISIHNTNRGPACGGIRLLPYESREAALKDVLRLSKGMSYKSALAGIAFGGGKSVMLSSVENKSPQLFHAFGEFVESLDGSYISAKDMNVSGADLIEVKAKTKHVLGIEGDPKSSGDPSPVTARGILRALEATVQHLNGSKSLKDTHIAIQGLGHVGWTVMELVYERGAKLTVTDVDQAALQKAEKEFGVRVVDTDGIYSVDCDIFTPCAIGGILNEQTVKMLRCQAVVGGANNQLATEKEGHVLYSRGILYAPDYAVNAGGIINVYQEFEGYDASKALLKADAIYDTMSEIFRRSDEEKIPPFIIADKIAEERIYGISSAPRMARRDVQWQEQGNSW